MMSLILATPLQFETLVFEAMSSCFPKQIGGHLGKVAKMAEGRQVFFAGCRLQVAGCRLKFNYNWKTAGTKNN